MAYVCAKAPGKVYRVITKYDVGTTVIVQQRGTEWSQIRVGETVGWMMNEFLRFGTHRHRHRYRR